MPLGCTSAMLDATTLSFVRAIKIRYASTIVKLPNDPPPPRKTLNSHNFHKAVHTIVEAYRGYDQSTTNPYRQCGKSQYYSMIHDAFMCWVKQLNTNF